MLKEVVDITQKYMYREKVEITEKYMLTRGAQFGHFLHQLLD